MSDDIPDFSGQGKGSQQSGPPSNDVPDFSCAGIQKAEVNPSPSEPPASISGPKISAKAVKIVGCILAVFLVGFVAVMWYAGRESRVIDKLTSLQTEAQKAATEGDQERLQEIMTQAQQIQKENEELLKEYADRQIAIASGKSPAPKAKEKPRPTAADLTLPSPKEYLRANPFERENWQRNVDASIAKMSWWQRRKASSLLEEFDGKVASLEASKKAAVQARPKPVETKPQTATVLTPVPNKPAEPATIPPAETDKDRAYLQDIETMLKEIEGK